MSYIEIEAEESIKNFIKCFWSVSRIFTVQSPYFELLPDGYAELILSYGSPCYIMDGEYPALLPNPFLIGLLEGPLKFHSSGKLTVIALRLYPWSLVHIRMLLEAGKFHRWEEKLFPHLCDGDIKAALIRLQSLIIEDIDSKQLSVFKRTKKILDGLDKNINLKDLAFINHTTSRTLQRLFLSNSGQSLKTVARKMRFEQIRNRIWEDPNVKFSQLAYEFNFTDPAHFNKEFKFYSHKTPGQFALEVIESKKLLCKHSVAFLQYDKK